MIAREIVPERHAAASAIWPSTDFALETGGAESLDDLVDGLGEPFIGDFSAVIEPYRQQHPRILVAPQFVVSYDALP